MAEPNDADYVVVRGTGTPLDGRWYDRSTWVVSRPSKKIAAEVGEGVVTPTGMIEVREDGAVAEIWAPEEWRVVREAGEELDQRIMDQR